MSRGRSLELAVAALAAIAGGCGSHDERSPTNGPRLGRQAPEDPFRLPAHVPRRGTGPPDARATGVVRAWLRALDAGDIPRAARYFDVPSQVQNATPVLTLDSRTATLAFNISLPCGAHAVGAAGARGFTIVTFRLIERVGGDCGGAAGRLARAAIRVTGGRIVEWYRLPDPEQPPPAGDVSQA
jgi:hypothetical protein